jgi:hypothetical protein
MGHGKVEALLTITGVKPMLVKEKSCIIKSPKGKPGVHTAASAGKGLKKMTPAQHNKQHPEKGRKAAAARKRKTKRRTKK